MCSSSIEELLRLVENIEDLPLLLACRYAEATNYDGRRGFCHTIQIKGLFPEGAHLRILLYYYHLSEWPRIPARNMRILFVSGSVTWTLQADFHFLTESFTDAGGMTIILLRTGNQIHAFEVDIDTPDIYDLIDALNSMRDIRNRKFFKINAEELKLLLLNTDILVRKSYCFDLNSTDKILQGYRSILGDTKEVTGGKFLTKIDIDVDLFTSIDSRKLVEVISVIGDRVGYDKFSRNSRILELMQ